MTWPRNPAPPQETGTPVKYPGGPSGRIEVSGLRVGVGEAGG